DDSFRVLRRHAVASLVMSNHAGSSAPSARASFLIERERWDVFNDIVKEEQKRLREMHVECTGPWPPYDFVRMQFGAGRVFCPDCGTWNRARGVRCVRCNADLPELSDAPRERPDEELSALRRLTGS